MFLNLVFIFKRGSSKSLGTLKDFQSYNSLEGGRFEMHDGSCALCWNVLFL